LAQGLEPSHGNTTPSPLGHFEATTLDVDFDWLARERAQALMVEMGFDDEEEPLTSSLTDEIVVRQ
jgi:hypothetical protein